MKTKIKQKIPIISIMILTTFVYFWQIWNEGLSNLYYSAGVYSMGQNIHAFFYNSLDVSGYVSIDKPPLGLWIQVLFTKVFGFNGVAILLPEVLSGILSVYFLYRMITKRFGTIAGCISALILCFTPIFVAVCRNSTIDGILILLLVLASEQVIKASENSSRKNIICSAILMGLAFNVKMLQAYVIVPAVYLTYLLLSKEKIGRRIVSILLSSVILLSISFSWIIAVDLTPSENRPYVGSSETNSELELTLGNNGLGRLLGMGSFNRLNINNKNDIVGQKPPMDNNQNIPKDTPHTQNDDKKSPTDERLPMPVGQENSNSMNNLPQQDGSSKMQGQGGEGGKTSIFRFYNNSISGQISWFILPSIIAVGYLIYIIFKKKLSFDSKYITLFYFTIAFVSMFIYFSFSSGMVHRYYLATIAWVIAGITGILFSEILKKFKYSYKFLLFFLICALPQLYIQYLYKDWLAFLLPVAIVLFAIAIFVIVFVIIKKRNYKILLSALATLLFLPAVWSFSPIIYGGNAQIPIAGPELVINSDSFDKRVDLSDLVKFLNENRGEAKYIASTPSAMALGNELILQSNEPVMVLGGFSGKDNTISLDNFKQLIEKGEIKYSILQSQNNQFNKMNNNGSNSIDSWIQQNCNIVFTINGYSVYELTTLNQ